MSTLKEISESKICITVSPKESIIQSFVKDTFSFITVAFLIYLSQGSTWWTFITGTMFILFLWIRIAQMSINDTTTFTDKEKAIKHINNADL